MANLIRVNLGTRVTFEASGGNVVLTLTSLAAGAGRISATFNKGTGAQELHIIGGLLTQFATTPVAGETIRIYLIEQIEARNGGSPAFKVPGDLGSSDAAVSDEDRFITAGHLITSLTVPPSPAADTEYVSKPFDIVVRAQKFQYGIWNGTVDALTATATEHELYHIDADDEIQ